MEHQLEWLNEEEGILSFFEGRTIFCTVNFYVTGEGEAEFRLQDVVYPETDTNRKEMQKKIISKVTDCISKTFLLLWNEGLEETVLVEQHGTEVAKILNSTGVVDFLYSEYMMKWTSKLQKTTDCGLTTIKLTKEEDGYFCENAEKTFFCRLLTYPPENPGEQCFYLYEVEVEKKERNRSIATACLTELLRLLAAEAPVTVYLQVGSYNEPAVHLYEKLGFEISEALDYYALKE